MVWRILTIAAGGAGGAIARYLLGSLVAARWSGSFPLGTWLINISGSFVIGLFLALNTARGEFQTGGLNWRLLIAVGFLGAYTTFSTFEHETLQLIENERFITALHYILSSVVSGLVAVRLGTILGREIVRRLGEG